jgi:hypothetical protein
MLFVQRQQQSLKSIRDHFRFTFKWLEVAHRPGRLRGGNMRDRRLNCRSELDCLPWQVIATIGLRRSSVEPQSFKASTTTQHSLVSAIRNEGPFRIVHKVVLHGSAHLAPAELGRRRYQCVAGPSLPIAGSYPRTIGASTFNIGALASLLKAVSIVAACQPAIARMSTPSQFDELHFR